MKGSDQCALMAELAAAENNSQPWRKSKRLEARCGSNTNGGERGETGEAGGRSFLLSYQVWSYIEYVLTQKNSIKMA